MTHSASDLPPTPSLVGIRWPHQAAMLEAYAHIVATTGVERGLVGPREVPRLWERHILNCALAEEAIAPESRVADVGSGAGLPGLVLAVVRPDLDVTLIEPLLRRATFLQEAVQHLGVADRVHVLRARAEEVPADAAFDVVTSRAVAALDVLGGWCLPLVRVGGQMLALKGATAADELAQAHDALAAWGGDAGEVLVCGVGVADPPTTVVRVTRVATTTPAGGRRSRIVSPAGAGRGRRPDSGRPGRTRTSHDRRS